jgi:hypothetical protein
VDDEEDCCCADYEERQGSAVTGSCTDLTWYISFAVGFSILAFFVFPVPSLLFLADELLSPTYLSDLHTTRSKLRISYRTSDMSWLPLFHRG